MDNWKSSNTLYEMKKDKIGWKKTRMDNLKGEITIEFSEEIFDAIFSLGLLVKAQGLSDAFHEEIVTAETFVLQARDLLEENMQVKDQIVLIPPHAKGDAYHPDCKYGFITSFSRDGNSAFCRYWKNEKGELRTKANSELTSVKLLRHFHSHSNAEVNRAIEKYDIEIS